MTEGPEREREAASERSGVATATSPRGERAQQSPLQSGPDGQWAERHLRAATSCLDSQRPAPTSQETITATVSLGDGGPY